MEVKGIIQEAVRIAVARSGEPAHAEVHHNSGSIRSLAEAVILQSLEDLWNPARKRESLLFFKGEGFRLYAEIAGINNTKRRSLLGMLAGAGAATKRQAMREAL
ncbi:MAG TPA: hypothetical protein VF790_06310 [Dissulfurispiraceae bacterium]